MIRMLNFTCQLSQNLSCDFKQSLILIQYISQQCQTSKFDLLSEIVKTMLHFNQVATSIICCGVSQPTGSCFQATTFSCNGNALLIKINNLSVPFPIIQTIFNLWISCCCHCFYWYNCTQSCVGKRTSHKEQMANLYVTVRHKRMIAQ